MPDQVLRVGLGQIRVRETVDQNVEIITDFLGRGRERGVHVVLFPEGTIGGYFGVDFMDPQALDGEAVERGLEAVRRAAMAHGVAAAVGASRRGRDGALRNCVVLFSARGEVVGEYVKTQLTESDGGCYVPGGALPVFDLDGIPIGLLICYDQRFPEPWRALALRGAQVVLHCSNACDSQATWKIPVVEAHLRSRAAENGYFVVSVNRGGPFQNWGSVAYDPHGLELARANFDREELVPVDLDLSRVTRAFLCERRTDLAQIVVGG